MAESVGLATARYGKDKIRVCRIVRNEKWHEIVEYNVCALVEGAIETSFTQADNSVVIATDSMKNITYYLAKISPFVLIPELFALHLGAFLLDKYAHLNKVFVTVEQLRWQRIEVNDQAQPHSFWRDGEEKRVVSTEVHATGKDRFTANVTAGISDLLVLKSSGSAFEKFVRDEFTTLAEVNDRIFSTSMDMKCIFPSFEFDRGVGLLASLTKAKADHKFEDIAASARRTTLEVFAMDESASVQATLYKMATKLIDEHAELDSVSYTLPNKHYIPVNLAYIDIDNTTPSQAEVFCPVAAPSGLISATVSRR